LDVRLSYPVKTSGRSDYYVSLPLAMEYPVPIRTLGCLLKVANPHIFVGMVPGLTSLLVHWIERNSVVKKVFDEDYSFMLQKVFHVWSDAFVAHYASIPTSGIKLIGTTVVTYKGGYIDDDIISFLDYVYFKKYHGLVKLNNVSGMKVSPGRLLAPFQYLHREMIMELNHYIVETTGYKTVPLPDDLLVDGYDPEIHHCAQVIVHPPVAATPIVEKYVPPIPPPAPLDQAVIDFFADDDLPPLEPGDPDPDLLSFLDQFDWYSFASVQRVESIMVSQNALIEIHAIPEAPRIDWHAQDIELRSRSFPVLESFFGGPPGFWDRHDPGPALEFAMYGDDVVYARPGHLHIHEVYNADDGTPLLIEDITSDHEPSPSFISFAPYGVEGVPRVIYALWRFLNYPHFSDPPYGELLLLMMFAFVLPLAAQYAASHERTNN